MKHSPQRRTLIVVLVASGISLLILALLAGPLRGWVRTSLARSVTQVVYGTKNARIFDSEFKPINKELASYGFTFVDKPDVANSYDPLNGCVVYDYSGLKESVTCQKVARFKPESLSDTMKLWPDQAPKIEQFLEANGWAKAFDDQPPYTELFNPPPGNGNWLSYHKNRGKVHCSFMIAYNPPYPNPDDQMWIHERCVRTVDYFGGY